MAWSDTRDAPFRGDFRAPAFVLLAVASVLEGYASLGTIGSPTFVTGPAGASLFALGSAGLAIGLTRPPTGARRSTAEVYLRRAVVLLGATTLAVVVGAPGFSRGTVGASELLLAIACLAAAGAGERRNVRRRHAAIHPSRRSAPSIASVKRSPAAALVGPHFHRHVD